VNQTTGLIVAGSVQEGSGVEVVTHSFTASNSSGGVLSSTDQIVKLNISANWVVGGVAKSTHLYTNLSNWR
jgi:hypothetical protein